MPDPSTPNPSDPESGEHLPNDASPNSESQGGDENPPKLKLKQILTPLSPHLTAPRPERGERIEKEKKAFIPSPEAVPVEPEPEPTPEELASLDTGAPPPPTKPEAGPPREIETSPPTDEELGLTDGETPQETAPQSDSPEPQKKNPVQKPAPKAKARKLVFALLVPVILIIAILALVQYLFDPLGLKIKPIEELPDLALADAKPLATTNLLEESQGSEDLLENLENQELASYLSVLKTRQIFPSSNPKGIFIDSVLFTEGDRLNPYMGLDLVEIDLEAGSFRLEDQSGQSYSIDIP
jgi:hypothetical protein